MSEKIYSPSKHVAFVIKKDDNLIHITGTDVDEMNALINNVPADCIQTKFEGVIDVKKDRATAFKLELYKILGKRLSYFNNMNFAKILKAAEKEKYYGNISRPFTVASLAELPFLWITLPEVKDLIKNKGRLNCDY